MDHLLPNGERSSEAQLSCYMGLLAHLSCKPEVLRVAPLHGARLFNAVASAIVQSGNITETPLLDAGLNGTGQVIQVRCVVR